MDRISGSGAILSLGARKKQLQLRRLFPHHARFLPGPALLRERHITHPARRLFALPLAHPLTDLMQIVIALPRHLLADTMDLLDEVVVGHSLEGGRISSGLQITGQV